MIEKGYYLKARITKDSEIAHAPPHVREIWDYFLREANHKDVKYNGRIIKRGQCVRSYKDIQESLHWKVGWRKMRYSKGHCETAMNWLKKRTMVNTEKCTIGMLVTVCNYETYQNPKNYETYNENYRKHTRNIQTADTINKNDNNDKDLYTEKFQEFWLSYPKRKGKIVGKKSAYERWLKMPKSELDRIIRNAKNYGIKNDLPKDPERFLKDDFWNDWDSPVNTSLDENPPEYDWGDSPEAKAYYNQGQKGING